MNNIRFLVVAIVLLLLQGSITHAVNLDEAQVNRYNLHKDMITRITDNVSKDQYHPIKHLYLDIYNDAKYFPLQQTDFEFTRKYGEDQPFFVKALSSNGSVQTFTSSSQAAIYQNMVDDKKSMFQTNQYFVEPYLYSKYDTIFLDGDKSNSGFDMVADYDDLEAILFGEDETQLITLQGFTKHVDGLWEWILGKTNYPSVQSDDARKSAFESQVRENIRLATPGDAIPVCTNDGYIGTVASLLTFSSDDDKQAFENAFYSNLASQQELQAVVDAFMAQQALDTGKIAEPAEALNALFPEFDIVDPTTATISQDEQTPITDLFDEVEQWARENACSNEYCLRINFVFNQVQQAPLPEIRPFSITRNLTDLFSIFDTMSKQNNMTRTIPRSVFSFPWDDPNLTIDRLFQLNVTIVAVPIFTQTKAKQIFNVDVFNAIGKALTKARSVSELEQGNQIDYGEQIASFIASLERSTSEADQTLETYQKTALLRAELDNMTNYSDLVLSKLRELEAQFKATQTYVSALVDIATYLNNLPTAK